MKTQLFGSDELSLEMIWLDSWPRQPHAAPAAELFENHCLLVVDNVPWQADLDVIRSGLIKKRREFKAPYSEGEAAKPVRKQVRNIIEHAGKLFAELYPSYKSIEERTSFRPMITGPEPLHFDTYGGQNPMVTAYVNVSSVPRVYHIGPTFPMLLQSHPDQMREAWKLAMLRGDTDVSYILRSDLGPLGREAPRHTVELAPGAIWFFNAKTVSHEVVYGEGAVGISWEVPDCGAKLQPALMQEMLP